MSEIDWQEEQKTLTLEGEPVLDLVLSRPVFSNHHQKIPERYYARLADAWLRHWSQHSYLDACMDLIAKREQSKIFRTWSAKLSGEVKFHQEPYLSIRMQARERRGDSRTLLFQWGNIWRCDDGSVVSPHEFFPNRRQKRHAWRQAIQQLERVQSEQGIMLVSNWQRVLRRQDSKLFSYACLTEQGLECYIPQCTITPAVDGILSLTLPIFPHKTAERSDL